LYYIDIAAGIPKKVTTSNLGTSAFVMGAAIDDNGGKFYISYEDISQQSSSIAVMEIPSGNILGSYFLGTGGNSPLVFHLAVLSE